MKLVKQVAEAFASIPAMARVALAEAANQVSLLEAAEHDLFETRLRALTFSEEEREGIRQGALDVARLGMSAEQFAEALRLYAAGAYITNEPEGRA